jgi:glycosyltransferase involved in cell wall biosynthesis
MVGRYLAAAPIATSLSPVENWLFQIGLGFMRVTIACATNVVFNLESPRSEGLGGIETACIELALALAARGHAVTLLTRTDKPMSLSGVANEKLDTLADVTGDALIVTNDARPFRLSRHTHRVLWFHNELPIEKGIRRGQLGAIVRYHPHAVFGGVVADRACSSLYPFASRQAIPLGVSAEFLSSRLDMSRSLKFVWISKPRRELKPTVEAWLRAHPRLPKGTSFHLFGVDQPALGIAVDEARRSDIVLHPRQTKAELATFYESAIAAICPGSKGETFCLAAAEAQCAGLPVLTLGIGALTERVQHGINGLVCRDTNQLSDALVEIATDTELCTLLRRGAQHNRALMSWDRVAALWEGWLKRL